MVQETNEMNFHRDTGKGKVLVEISNPGCVPCEQMKKNILPVAEGSVDGIFILDASENIEMVIELQDRVGSIMAVPVLLLFEEGEFMARHDGMMTGDDLLEFVSDEGE